MFLSFFKTSVFFKIFAQLKKAQLKEGVFIDVFYQAFRLDRLILCLGEGFISFNPPEIFKKTTLDCNHSRSSIFSIDTSLTRPFRRGTKNLLGRNYRHSQDMFRICFNGGRRTGHSFIAG